MKKLFVFRLVLVLGFAVLCSSSFAGEPHYVNGIEGIKGATLPPPGVYGRLYSAYYHADTVTDDAGKKVDIGFDLKVYAVVPRIIWVSEYEVLGGNFFVDAALPIMQTKVSVDAANVSDSKFGIGDLFVEPLGVTWHGARYDAALSFGGYIPVGQYDEDNAASPGKDMWTGMFTAGGTLYADTEKTWSASVLSRYEIHTEKRDKNYTPGNDFHFEWGLGKTLNKTIDVGLAGYCYWQVTDDSGDDTDSDKSRVMAMGPEISVFIPSQVMFVSARYLWEFESKNYSEGAIGVLTLTKRF